MKSFMPNVAASFVLAASLFVAGGSVLAQGDADVEEKFVKMLTNATLKGTWAPVQGGQIGGERADSGYRIARVEKKPDGTWFIVSVFKLGDRQIEFPIAASVKVAGDTAVLILNDVKAGPGKANWSARILFHDDVYAGRWWETSNEEHGGTMAGTIERSE